MLWFILGLIAAVVTLVAVFVTVFDEEDRATSITVAVIAALLSFVFLMGSSVREVPARSVGIPVTVGKVGNPLLPGLHWWQAPWETVDILNEKNQTTYFDGAKNCIQVRIGGQQLACWQGSLQWKVFDSAARGLFNNYGNTGNIMTEIRDAVVTRNLTSALTSVFQDYNPIFDVSQNATSSNSQFTRLQPKLIAALKHEIGRRIDVISLISKNMIYNKNTQDNLERIQQQYGKTAVARQLVVTNEALNAANSKLNAKSLSLGVLINTCLQVTQEAITNNYPLNAGFNCFNNPALALSGK